jgi:tRNA U34 2-thiouridine synthase MnmA/TrmU
MKLHDVPSHPSTGGPTKHCCGLDDSMDARRVADKLGIPFFVMDLREAFQKAVMDVFAKEYLAGRTPNPCILCNGVLKFQVLLTRARALGATHLATGHYAQVNEAGGLRAATDAHKDQSYFLFPIPPDNMVHLRFPLGGMTKEEVRGHATRMDLVTADKPESQDVCFIPDDDHARFVFAAYAERSVQPRHAFDRQVAAALAHGNREERLATIVVPTLVLHGTADNLITLGGGQRTAEAIPGADLVVVEGWGHDLAPGAWPQLIEAISTHCHRVDGTD